MKWWSETNQSWIILIITFGYILMLIIGLIIGFLFGFGEGLLK